MLRCFHLPVLLGFASFAAQAQTAGTILTQKCIQCHGQASLMGGLDLRSREAALKGGQHGPALVAGNADASSLYRHLTGQQQPQMPLGGRLSEPEIETLKNWIDSGAAWDSAPGTEAPVEKQFTTQQRRYWAFQK